MNTSGVLEIFEVKETEVSKNGCVSTLLPLIFERVSIHLVSVGYFGRVYRGPP